MLEDGEYNDIVSWGYTGDSFVVKVSFRLAADRHSRLAMLTVNVQLL